MKRIITITIEQDFEERYEEVAMQQMNDEEWLNEAKETIEDAVFCDIVGEPIDGIEVAVAVNIEMDTSSQGQEHG